MYRQRNIVVELKLVLRNRGEIEAGRKGAPEVFVQYFNPLKRPNDVQIQL
jgi:hypothetical protein